MKKILLFASALAGLFLAGSCQRENLEPMESANTVTYTVQVPGALSTKTIGENVAAVTELVYEVYRTEATSADDHTKAETKLFRKTATITNGTATVEFELVNNQNFRVLFWAQVPGNGVYNVESLKNVTISQALNANAENYAAFAGADYIKAGESIVGRTLPLVRPIAQLNIGTDDASLSIEGQTTVTIATTAVTVNGLSTTFNVAENKAGDISADDYVYDKKSVALSESTFAVNGTNYNYVAMNYVGFAPQMGTNVKVTYTINTENVGTITNTIDNVPVKANHRTNIVGNLITSMSDYTITLDEEWADEQYYGPEFVKEPAYDADTKTYTVVDKYELLWVADQVNSGKKTFKGETVQLAADIDLENKLWTPIGLNADNSKKFYGTFEGVALTKADTYPVIRNLYVETSPGYTAAGFFGALNGTAKNFGIENATIKHISTGDPTDNGIAVVAGSIYNKGNIEGVTVKNATVEGNRYVGGIAGYTYGNVKNCSVENLTLKAIPNQLADGSYDNGDKVGGIVGAFWWESTYNVSGNTANNVSIYAYRDAGIIAGFATGAGVKNNTVEGKNNITIDQETYFYADKPANAGEIVGNLSGALADGNAVTGDVSYTTLINVDEPESFASVVAAAKDGDIITIADGEFDLPSSVGATGEGTITFVGNGMESTQLNGSTNPSGNADSPGNYAHGKDIVFKNMTFKTVNVGYQGGIGHAKSVTFINCKIIGQFYCHSEAPHYFYDCTIDPLTGYLYTYASDCVFEGCTFEASEGKALQVYEDASVGENTVTIKDCHFVAAKQAQTWDGKPVTGIDINSNGAIFNVYVENCTTTGFPEGLNSGSELYNIKDGGLAYTYLTVDGVVVNRPGFTKLANYPNIWVKDNNYYVFDKAGLAELNTYFKANWCSNDVWNHEYHIGADIDAEGLTWNSVWVNVGWNGLDGLVFDGDNHTISNLKINGSLFGGTPNGGDAGTAPGYVKDITIDNATVTGDHWTAVFWGDSYGEIVYDNVTVKNTSVTGNCNVAIFLAGTVIEGAGSIDNILFKNCKVENCSVVANGKDGQDPTGASVFCGRAYGKTKLTFEGSTVDSATTVENKNGLVGGMYGYTTWYGTGFVGTGACDTFTNWDGLDFELVSDGLLKEKNTAKYYVSSAAGLEKMNEMFSNKTAGRDVVLNLTEDIDFTGKTWTPVDSHADTAFEIAEINGNGHTISNLTINGKAMFTRFAGTDNVVVKNITFDNATVNSNGSINTSILVGHTYQNVLLDNVDVKNSTITGGYKVAPLIATVYNESTSTITATLKNCDVENTTVKATSYDFCTTGMVAFVYAGDNDQVAFENCTVSDVKLYAPNVYTAHAAIYTTGSETLFNEAEGVTVNNVTFENI